LVRHEVGLGLEKPFFRIRVGLEGWRRHGVWRDISVAVVGAGKSAPPSTAGTGAPSSAASAESAAPSAGPGGLHPVAAASSRTPAGHGASSRGACSIISWHFALSFQFVVVDDLLVLASAPTAAFSLAAAVRPIAAL
jgi:hypothetical protein